ncbi:MAG: hypothetical protein ACT6XY_11345, partial [Phreatobacter sp.]
QAFSERADPTLRTGDQVISAEQARLLSMPADQRQAVREEIASEQRARREAERLERIDRSRTRNGAPRPTIGIDGAIRAAAEPEPVEIRGSTPATPAVPVTPEAAPDPDRRPVRVIGPLYAPRADTPSLPSGG